MFVSDCAYIHARAVEAFQWRVMNGPCLRDRDSLRIKHQHCNDTSTTSTYTAHQQHQRHINDTSTASATCQTYNDKHQYQTLTHQPTHEAVKHFKRARARKLSARA